MCNTASLNFFNEMLSKLRFLASASHISWSQKLTGGDLGLITRPRGQNHELRSRGFQQGTKLLNTTVCMQYTYYVFTFI